MKRGMAGGAYRGPVGLRRQKRTIRFVQLMLVLAGIGSLAFAVAVAIESARGAGTDPGSLVGPASYAQAIVLLVLATGAFAGAWLLADGKDVRIPTPARLEELAGRAERVAIGKAEEASRSS